MEKHSVFGVKIDDLSLSELEQLILGWLGDGRTHTIVTPNPEFILAARLDAPFRDLLNNADLSLPDGVGLRFAVSALTGKRLRNRHTGVDTLSLLAKICAEKNKCLALIGGNEGVADQAAARLASSYPNLQIQTIDPGQITISEKNELLTNSSDRYISSISSCTVVAVGLGMKKQEGFMSVIAPCLPAGRRSLQTTRQSSERPLDGAILIGVGGAFDMLAGTRRRAPLWIRRIGLEWIWRLLIEPRRWRRIFRAAFVFPITVVQDTLKHRRFIQACKDTIPEIIRQLLLNRSV